MDCDAVVGAHGGLCVIAAAGLQSNFPACRSAHRIDKSHSWLLCRGKWRLYCFFKTNVSSGQDRSYFPGQRKTHTRTHSHKHTHTSTTLLNWKLLLPRSLFPFITLQNSAVPVELSLLSSPFSSLVCSISFEVAISITLPRLNQLKVAEQSKKFFKALVLFLYPWNGLFAVN